MNGYTHTKLDYLKAYYYISVATYSVMTLNYIFVIDTIAFNQIILMKRFYIIYYNFTYIEKF